MNFTTEYSFIYILGCAVFAGLLTFFAYYRNSSVREIATPWKWVLSLLRFTAVFIIAFLLLNPMLRDVQEEKEKPLIIFAQDESESILLNADSVEYKTKFPAEVDALLNQLSQNYRVEALGFGDQISDTNFNYNQKYTDYGSLLQTIDDRYANTNLGAVIIASDGLYNRGVNPVHHSGRTQFPVYSVMMGDTTAQRDIQINDVKHNAIVYKGNRFPVDVYLDEFGFDDESVSVDIWKDGNRIESQKITLEKSQKIHFELEAEEEGVQAFQVRVSTLKGELTEVNNQSRFYVEVIESKQKILLTARSAHPDIAAFRQTLESQVNYEVTFNYFKDLPQDFNAFNLVVVFSGEGEDLMSIRQKAASSSSNVCWVVQSNVNTSIWNGMKLPLQLNDGRNQTQQVTAKWNKQFQLFTVGENSLSNLGEWPPIEAPFGKAILQGNGQVAVYQSIGKVVTENPLISLVEQGNSKTGFIIGSGYWRWRIINFAQDQNREAYQEIIGKFFSYLMLKEDKSRFRLQFNQFFAENEPVVIRAELYNASYELINDVPVKVTLTDQNEKAYPFEMLPQGNSYVLQAGVLPVGEYTIQATATRDGQEYVKTGKIQVRPITLESSNTQANFALLEAWSQQTGGIAISTENLNQIPQLLEERDDLVTTIHTKEKLTSILEKWWVIVLALVLLSCEWFIRKWQGSY